MTSHGSIPTLAWACVALWACDAREPRHSQGTVTVAAKPAARPPAPVRPPAPPATHRPSVVALAVDQSASMQGFAATGSMTTAIENAERAIRDAAHGEIVFYALGETAEKVPEDRLLDPSSYAKGAADLKAALDAQQLRDADIAVVFTDGQPTAAHGPQAQLGMCTPAGTQVISDLHDWFANHVDTGEAIWIVLEKLPFAGRFFLNCRGANQVPEISSRLGRRLACDSRECSYLIPKAHPEDRALVGIVFAKPPFADAASALVQTYLQGRSGATAVRLHRSERDRDTVDQVTASRVGAGVYPADVRATEPGTYEIHAHCPEGNPDMAVRVCVRLRASTPPPGQPLARMDPAEIADAQAVRAGRTVGDWLELPRGQSLDPALIPRLHPARHDCTSMWPVYLERAATARRASAGSSDCTGGDGIDVHELITACGCRPQQRQGATEIRFVQRYHSTESGVEHELAAKQLSADPQSWFEQPDRVNGLSELVHLLAAARTPDATPYAVLRLVIAVYRR